MSLKFNHTGSNSLNTTSDAIPALSEAGRQDSNDPTSRRYSGYAQLKSGGSAESINQDEAVQSLSGLMETNRIAVQNAKYPLQTENKATECKSC